MSAVEVKKSVRHLKVLVSLVISLNQAQETDVLFVQVVLSSTQLPNYNGYNTRQCRDTGCYNINMKTHDDYIPFIDMTPADPDTIMTAWSKTKVLTTEYDQSFNVCTSDFNAVNVVGHTLNSLTMLF